MTSRTALQVVATAMPSRCPSDIAKKMAMVIDKMMSMVPPDQQGKARAALIDHLRAEEELPPRVIKRNGRYYWRPEVIGTDGKKCRVNRLLGRDWDKAAQEQYQHYEATLATARRTGDFAPLFAAIESRRRAEKAEIEADEIARRHAVKLRELWKQAGYGFHTRGGASYATVPMVWGDLTVGELVPQVIDDGIRRMESGDYMRPFRGGRAQCAKPLSLNTIFRYVRVFRQSLDVLRKADESIPDIFAQRTAQLPQGKTLMDLIYPNRADATTITQRRKPSVYLDWETERLPFIGCVLKSGLPYSHDLAALLLVVSFTGARPGSLAGLMWEATPGGNYVDGGNIVLHQTKVTRRRRQSVPEMFEINDQLRAVLAVQRKRTGGVGRVFPLLPADACDAIDRLADRWQLSRLRAYLFKHSALTDLALIPGGTPAQLAAEVHILAETLDKHYILARGVKARHYRPGKRGASILSRLHYKGLKLDPKRGTITV